MGDLNKVLIEFTDAKVTQAQIQDESKSKRNIWIQFLIFLYRKIFIINVSL